MGIGRAEEHAIGHDDGGAAAGLEQAQEERHEEQLGLLGLDDALEVLGGGLVIEAAGEGRIGEDEGVLLRVVLVALGQRVSVADVGVFHAVQEHVHAADAQHGAVEIVAVEGALVKSAAARRRVLVDGIAVVGRAGIPTAAMRKPAVPQAGSQILSLGVGAVMSTISLMMWRGVRNWPFWPALAILPSMYS